MRQIVQRDRRKDKLSSSSNGLSNSTRSDRFEIKLR